MFYDFDDKKKKKKKLYILKVEITKIKATKFG